MVEYTYVVKNIQIYFMQLTFSLYLSSFTDGYEMPSDSSRQQVFNNGTMIIQKASKVLDEGYYTCAAFGNQRKDSNSGTVQIQVLSKYHSLGLNFLCRRLRNIKISQRFHITISLSIFSSAKHHAIFIPKQSIDRRNAISSVLSNFRG